MLLKRLYNSLTVRTGTAIRCMNFHPTLTPVLFGIFGRFLARTPYPAASLASILNCLTASCFGSAAVNP